MCVYVCVLGFAPVTRVYVRTPPHGSSKRVRTDPVCREEGPPRPGLSPPRKEVECINISRTTKTREERGEQLSADYSIYSYLRHRGGKTTKARWPNCLEEEEGGKDRSVVYMIIEIIWTECLRLVYLIFFFMASYFLYAH